MLCSFGVLLICSSCCPAARTGHVGDSDITVKDFIENCRQFEDELCKKYGVKKDGLYLTLVVSFFFDLCFLMCQLEAAWRTRRVRWVSSACQGLSEAVPELEPSASGRKSTNLDDIYDTYAKGPCFILFWYDRVSFAKTLGYAISSLGQSFFEITKLVLPYVLPAEDFEKECVGTTLIV